MAYLILILVPIVSSYIVYTYTYWAHIKTSNKKIKEFEERIIMNSTDTNLIIKLFDEHRNDFKELRLTVGNLNTKVEQLALDIREIKSKDRSEANMKALKNTKIVAYVTTSISALALIIVTILNVYKPGVKILDYNNTDNINKIETKK